MPTTAAGLTYLDGRSLRRSLLSAADWVDAGREELNRINVFPVPDGDTGTNFGMTLRASAEGVRRLRGAALPAVSRAMAEACVFGARGNSGMLLSQFLVGFREAIGGKERAELRDVAGAIRRGAERVHQSLDEPVEGTILTVCREAADAAERAAPDSANLRDFMHHVLDRAQLALQRTPELLAVLKRAGVVDAGAKAFVRLLEGVVRLIDGDRIRSAAPWRDDEPSAAAVAEVAADRDYQYCTEVLVRGEKLPATTEIRGRLRELGGSIVVLALDDLRKLHVHTDQPDRVFELAGTWGTVETTKADDMRSQHRGLHGGDERSVAIVVDSSCDLPDDLVDRHGIVVVPLQVLRDGTVYQDRLDIRGDELYTQMRSGAVYTTSQPTPGALVRAFEDASAAAHKVIGLFVAGVLSGTLGSARTAARSAGLENLTVVDSRTVSLGLGMLALRAAELAAEGVPTGRIAQEVHRVRDQSGGLFTVDTFANLLRSGRVSRGRAWLGGLLDIKPILELNREGRVIPLDRVRGREALIPRVLQHLERRFTPRPTVLRLAVVHADAADVAERLRAELIARFRPKACYVQSVTAALGVHTGPGAWGVFYQVED